MWSSNLYFYSISVSSVFPPYVFVFCCCFVTLMLVHCIPLMPDYGIPLTPECGAPMTTELGVLLAPKHGVPMTPKRLAALTHGYGARDFFRVSQGPL